MIIIKYIKKSAELIYSLDILLTEFLGLEYQFQEEPVEHIEISQTGIDSKLTINADFFNKMEDHWLKVESMPSTPLEQWHVKNDLDIDLLEESVPIIYGKPGLDKLNKQHWHLKLDVFGSAFFMLSRYEEEITKNRDRYDRFPASSSIAYQEGFINRPIVNEYSEILWVSLKSLFPNLKRKTRKFKMVTSCDVDHPYSCLIKNSKMQLRQVMGDLFKRKSPLKAMNNSLNFIATKLGIFSFDQNYSALYNIMAINEEHNTQAIFYFIAGHTGDNTDGCYTLSEPVIRKLLRDIHQRGHIIGLHPSFETYQNSNNLCHEANYLRQILKEESIQQKLTETRQHYLRWNSQTIQNIADANLVIDSTLSYTDHTGFRCGTCYEYPLYDLLNKTKTTIMQRPLIIMEATVIYESETLMGYGRTNKTIEYIKKIKQTVRHYNGDFTLLWHNSELTTLWDEETYKSIISA